MFKSTFFALKCDTTPKIITLDNKTCEFLTDFIEKQNITTDTVFSHLHRHNVI